MAKSIRLKTSGVGVTIAAMMKITRIAYRLCSDRKAGTDNSQQRQKEDQHRQLEYQPDAENHIHE